jgi:hypothetical protein
MSIFIVTRFLCRTVIPTMAFAGAATTVRAQLPNLYGMPNVHARTVFVPPKTVVQ